MSAKIAVLGLVIEEPGPAHRLTAKLRQRLASASFVDSNVYSALTRLERDGLVRAVTDVPPPVLAREIDHPGQGAPRAAVKGTRLASVGSRQVEPEVRRAPRRTPGSRADSRSFEATAAGVRHFEEWLLRSSTAPPLRDELHMKVALCQPHNLPRLVELVYGQELICLARVQELKHTFERMRPPAPNRWSGLVLVHIRDAELSFWEARLTWLQGIRASLESMHAEYERATGATRLRSQTIANASSVAALATQRARQPAYVRAGVRRSVG